MLAEVKIWRRRGRIGEQRGGLVGSEVEAFVLYFPLFLKLFCFLNTSFTQSPILGRSRPTFLLPIRAPHRFPGVDRPRMSFISYCGLGVPLGLPLSVRGFPGRLAAKTRVCLAFEKTSR